MPVYYDRVEGALLVVMTGEGPPLHLVSWGPEILTIWYVVWGTVPHNRVLPTKYQALTEPKWRSAAPASQAIGGCAFGSLF